jgi:hypothetical protein
MIVPIVHDQTMFVVFFEPSAAHKRLDQGPGAVLWPVKKRRDLGVSSLPDIALRAVLRREVPQHFKDTNSLKSSDAQHARQHAYLGVHRGVPLHCVGLL